MIASIETIQRAFRAANRVVAKDPDINYTEEVEKELLPYSNIRKVKEDCVIAIENEYEKSIWDFM